MSAATTISPGCHHGPDPVRHFEPSRDYWLCRFCDEVVCLSCYARHTNEKHEPPPAPLSCPCCNDFRHRVRRFATD